MKIQTIIVSLVIFLLLSNESKSQLTLSVSGLVKQESRLYIAVFDNAENFLTEKIFYAKKIATTIDVAIIEINDLPFGTYAISVFQDLNANEKLDKKLFGIPAEPYGFSISAAKFTRAPTFSESSFEYSKERELKIDLTKR
jgi:uncharacterized protein (DUF2141 family)